MAAQGGGWGGDVLVRTGCVVSVLATVSSHRLAAQRVAFVPPSSSSKISSAYGKSYGSSWWTSPIGVGKSFPLRPLI